MPPPLLPDWVIIAALVALALVLGHIDLVKQGRLRGYSIATHFVAMASVACVPLIELFMPLRWHGGAKYLLVGLYFALMIGFGAVTKKLPAQSQPRRWRKARRRGLS